MVIKIEEVVVEVVVEEVVIIDTHQIIIINNNHPRLRNHHYIVLKQIGYVNNVIIKILHVDMNVLNVQQRKLIRVLLCLAVTV